MAHISLRRGYAVPPIDDMCPSGRSVPPVPTGEADMRYSVFHSAPFQAPIQRP